MELVTIRPNNWKGSKTYITARKFKTYTSYGKEFIRYSVVTRHTFINSDGEYLITETSKGLTYSSGEITEVNI